MPQDVALRRRAQPRPARGGVHRRAAWRSDDDGSRRARRSRGRLRRARLRRARARRARRLHARAGRACARRGRAAPARDRATRRRLLGAGLTGLAPDPANVEPLERLPPRSGSVTAATGGEPAGSGLSSAPWPAHRRLHRAQATRRLRRRKRHPNTCPSCELPLPRRRARGSAPRLPAVRAPLPVRARDADRAARRRRQLRRGGGRPALGRPARLLRPAALHRAARRGRARRPASARRW